MPPTLRSPEPADDADSRWFHKKHVISFTWQSVGAVLTGLILLVVGLAVGSWYSARHGPQPVLIVPRDTVAADSLVLPAGVDLSSPQAEPTANGVRVRPVSEYVREDLGKFAWGACPTPFQRTGVDTAIRLVFREPSTADRMPELFLRISTLPVLDTVQQVYERQYQPRERMRLAFTTPNRSGIYTVEAGFFLSREYAKTPRIFYRRVCRLEVRDWPT